MTSRPVARPARSEAARRGRDERGDYALFIAVIATVLLLFGGMAYDGPRLMAARQDALHAANEAARVAAATVASGGTLAQARQAVQDRLDATGLIYGETVAIDSLDCVGSRVQVTVMTGYFYRSVIGLARPRQPIEAVGAAEARLVLPGDEISTLHYLGRVPAHLAHEKSPAQMRKSLIHGVVYAVFRIQSPFVSNLPPGGVRGSDAPARPSSGTRP